VINESRDAAIKHVRNETNVLNYEGMIFGSDEYKVSLPSGQKGQQLAHQLDARHQHERSYGGCLAMFDRCTIPRYEWSALAACDVQLASTVAPHHASVLCPAAQGDPRQASVRYRTANDPWTVFRQTRFWIKTRRWPTRAEVARDREILVNVEMVSDPIPLPRR
jgi:hypothetical protein